MTQSVKNALMKFTVRKCPPELIAPAEPTPRELKPLSNIDDQQGLRFQVPGIQFYRASNLEEGMAGRDPVKVIREALAKVLVFYYPFAGRLREELPSKKLFVDCNNEGIMFIEAEADITLENYFNMALLPPFSGIDELLYDVPGSADILDTPLLLIQVTRLLCGGFVFGIRLNHTMADAQGLVQFITALTEIAKGAVAPSTLPVWQREMLLERDPPRVTYTHNEYVEQVPNDNGLTMMPPLDDMILKSFFLGPRDLLALRRFVPDNIGRYSTFEVLTASIWRCRTIAIKSRPDEHVGILFTVSARRQLNPPLPKGYYGNSFVCALAVSTAVEIHAKSLGHALERIKEVKNSINEEYIRSLVDFMAIKGRCPILRMEGNYIISDVTRVGFQDIDFGWGKPVYSGPAISKVDVISAGGSFLVPYTQKNGEVGIVVPICLPKDAMETFAVRKLITYITGCV